MLHIYYAQTSNNRIYIEKGGAAATLSDVKNALPNAPLDLISANPNVWLLRASRSTAYRGGAATNMREEFAAYGLPAWMVVVVGVLKVGAALALIAGIWYPPSLQAGGPVFVSGFAYHRWLQMAFGLAPASSPSPACTMAKWST